MNNEHTQQADDPSGPGWRDVTTGDVTQDGDMVRADDDFPLGRWLLVEPGETVTDDDIVRRRIEPQPQPQPNPDDPSGEGWRDVEPDEILQDGDMFPNGGRWERTGNPGITAKEGRGGTYRRRIGPQQPSDSEPETMDDLRRRLAECEVLLAEAERSGEQVNAELQQLREQVQTLTRERDRYRNQLAGAIEHSSAAAARQQVLEALQTWLRPVLELVAEHPEDASPLAVAVLGFLPGIASRLIEE